MKMVPIGDVVEGVNTWNPNRDPDAEFTYVDLSAIDNVQKAITSPSAVTGGEAPSRARQIIKTHDVLVSTVRPNLNAVALVGPEFDGATASTGFTILRPTDQIDSIYLFHWVRTPRFVSDMVRKATGASYPAVSDRIVKDSLIPLPPLDEQRRIAAILDQVDAVRRVSLRSGEEIDTLVQSVFVDRFGYPAELLSHWPTAKLGEELDFLTSGSRGWAKHYAASGDPFLRIQNVKRDDLDLDDLAYVDAPDTAEARRTRVQPGDVLVSITADLGRTAVVPESLGVAYINQHLAILRSTSFVPRYLSVYLTSPLGQRQLLGRNRQAVKAGLNFDDIRSLKVPFPPLDDQQSFAAVCSRIDRLRTERKSASISLKSLFASVQSRAFSGQL